MAIALATLPTFLTCYKCKQLSVKACKIQCLLFSREKDNSRFHEKIFPGYTIYPPKEVPLHMVEEREGGVKPEYDYYLVRQVRGVADNFFAPSSLPF